MTEKGAVIYWDSSALLSYLFRDSHSKQVTATARLKGIHLLTALAIAEAYTEISRLQRDGLLPEKTVVYLYEMLEGGPWSRLNLVPDSSSLRELSAKWTLKGPMLWHLATAKTLHREFPELMILTIDRDLARASEGESIRLCIAVNAKR
jgi:predicted nucleic acid-binding protein